jgi:hypothetical protein
MPVLEMKKIQRLLKTLPKKKSEKRSESDFSENFSDVNDVNQDQEQIISERNSQAENKIIENSPILSDE